MNPLAWPGPQFLLFYLVTAVVVVIASVVMRRQFGPRTSSVRRLTDPGAIALLAGGPSVAVRTVALELIDQCRLQEIDGRLVVSEGVASEDGLAGAILSVCESPTKAHELVNRSAVERELGRLRVRLEGDGLAPDSATRWMYRAIPLVGLAVLLALGFAKVERALALGHHNLGFLYVLMIGATIATIIVVVRLPRATPAGRAMLAHLRQLFLPLSKGMADRSEERAFLLALYGGAVLGGADLLLWRRFDPPQAVSSTSGCGSSSSCGSSGGGGGGCGGGGCGGCGS